MFSRMPNSLVLRRMLSDVSGSRKSNLVVVISVVSFGILIIFYMYAWLENVGNV